MRKGIPIRASLAVLVLATALPFVALIAYSAYSQAQLETEQAGTESLRAARATATEVEATLRRTRELLSYLAEQPAVRSFDPAQCDLVFKSFSALFPQYTNLVTVNRNGERVCSAARLPPGASTKVDPQLFLAETLRSRAFTVGQVLRGVFSDRWILAVAHPVTDERGEIRGVVSLPVDLAKLRLVPRPAELPPQAVARIVDARGTVIGSSVDPDRWIGQSFKDVPWFSLLEPGRAATGRAADIDGGERIFGAVPIEGTTWYAAVGIPVDVVYGPVRNRLMLNAVVTLGALMLAIALGYLIARRIAGPVEIIAAAAREATQSPSGHELAHATVPFAPKEIQMLASDLGAMLKARSDAELELRESEAGLRRAQTMAQLAHVITNPDGVFESWSETLLQLIGAESAVPQTTREWLELIHPDDRESFRATSMEAAAKDARGYVEYRLRRPHDEWIHVRQMMEPMPAREPEGARRWFSTLQNITAQKRAAEAIRLAEHDYRSIFENTVEGIYRVDPDGRVVAANPALSKILGYESYEDMMTGISNVAHQVYVDPEARERYRALLREHGTVTGFETQWRRKDGSVIWVSLSGRQVRESTGAPGYHLGTAQDITRQKRNEEDLLRFRLALDNSADMVLIIDRATMRHVDVNQTACRLLGYTREELLLMGPQDTLPVSREDLEKAYDQLIANQSLPSGMRSHYRCKDGSLLPFESTRHVFRSGDTWLVAAISRDIRERIASEQALRESEAGLKRLNRVYAVLSGINSLIVRVRDRQELFEESCRLAVDAGGFVSSWIAVVDKEAMRLKPVAWQGGGQGYIDLMPLDLKVTDPMYGLAGQTVTGRQAIVVDDMATDSRVLLKEEARKRGFHSLVMLPLMVAGEPVAVLALYAVEIGYFDQDEMRLLLELAADISFALEHMTKTDKLEYLAYHDSLTGLANRALLMERLTLATGTASRDQRKFALVIADIERFNVINDTLGRQAGDELLKQMAKRVTELAGDSNRVARVSADHFAVMIPEVEHEEKIARIIQEGAARVEGESFTVGGTELRVAVRSGIAMFPNDGAEADILFKNAEAALKNAKASGEKYLFYTQQMSERVAGKLSLENKLRLALDNEEFVLHYQPKVELEGRRIVGLEALIRWQSPELGLVPPMKFIPLLEETGLILPVGSWALRRTSLDHRSWVEQKLKPPRVAVNVSAIQLRQRDFVGVVEGAIIDGVAPTGIDLEITESLIMEDIQRNIEKLNSVRGLGVKIAIDDFGTGYSSLAYLAKLPVETLKIDRSFIITMLKDPNTMTLVQTMITLAHSLRLKVVAEGVETEEQANVLRLLRCDQMQGYLFSKPLPLEQVTALLKPSRLPA